MKNKVLKLCKRLSKVTASEIAPILMLDEKEVSNILNELVSEDKLTVREDLIYFYFEEEISKIPEKVSRSVNGITNYQDIQRYCYYPGTNNIYSFFGFSNNFYC